MELSVSDMFCVLVTFIYAVFLSSSPYGLVGIHIFELLITPFFPLSSWFQVNDDIKNRPTVYKTHNRHDRWSMVDKFHLLLLFFNASEMLLTN